MAVNSVPCPGRSFRASVTAGALIVLAGGCAGKPAPGAPGPDAQAAYSGSLEIRRTSATGKPSVQTAPAEASLVVRPDMLQIRERGVSEGAGRFGDAEAFFAPGGDPFRLQGYRVRDSSGAQTAVRYDSSGTQTLAESVPGTVQTNRTTRIDGSYRDVERIAARNAVVVSSSSVSANGSGSREIDVFPHSSEAGSTYYGFLNDAQMQFDFAARPDGGTVTLLGDGGYAKGYAARPPMHAIRDVPAWFSAANGLYARSVTALPRTPPWCRPALTSQAKARGSSERIAVADPIDGTSEIVTTQAIVSDALGPVCVRVDDEWTEHFTGARARATLTLALQSRVTPQPIPAAFAALVREEVRRAMRIRSAQARADVVRSLAVRR